ncbi:MAG: nicotinate (nicotinamide) nucleotide adenylyltransferase [Candidatus Wallbacteria bacterium]|nr:nicotinate (nicotinamide) nucleotide adenylyltransferase [Candidatus Wallbacteria bacterium]
MSSGADAPTLGSRPAAQRRVGVLGGTFDPPHEGHLCMAREALERAGLDEVVFVPVRSPSHKAEASAPFADRLEMVRLLIAGEPQMSVSDVEAHLGEKSYTVPMLEELQRRLGADVELHFLIGADSLEQFHLWFRYRDILRLAKVVAFSRPGFRLANPNLTPPELARIHLLDGLWSHASSRRFRERRDCPVPAAVAAYAAARGLYA